MLYIDYGLLAVVTVVAFDMKLILEEPDLEARAPVSPGLFA